MVPRGGSKETAKVSKQVGAERLGGSLHLSLSLSLTVDGAKGAEAKHLGAVVGDGGVVEGPVQHEQADVSVGGPHLGDDAEDADRGGHGHQGGQHGRRAGVIEKDADERNRDDAAQREGQVEEVVDLDGLVERSQDRLVLGPDRRDEVVDACHLYDWSAREREKRDGLVQVRFPKSKINCVKTHEKHDKEGGKGGLRIPVKRQMSRNHGDRICSQAVL